MSKGTCASDSAAFVYNGRVSRNEDPHSVWPVFIFKNNNRMFYSEFPACKQEERKFISRCLQPCKLPTEALWSNNVLLFRDSTSCVAALQLCNKLPDHPMLPHTVCAMNRKNPYLQKDVCCVFCCGSHTRWCIDFIWNPPEKGLVTVTHISIAKLVAFWSDICFGR